MIEVMLVVGIIGIVASMAPKFFIEVTRFVRMNLARYEIQRDSKNVMVTINRNMRQAQASSILIDQVSGQPYYSRIAFNKFVSDTSSRSMTFYQEGNSLFAVDNGSTRTLCTNLRYIAFSYPRTDDDNVVAVSLTLEKATYGGESKALQLAVEKIRVMND